MKLTVSTKQTLYPGRRQLKVGGRVLDSTKKADIHHEQLKAEAKAATAARDRHLALDLVLEG